MYLERGGGSVLTADDGHAALDLIRAHLPDVVVLDRMLPGLNGLAGAPWTKRGRSRVAPAGYGIETELPLRLDLKPGLHFYFDKHIVRNGYAWAFPCGKTMRYGVFSPPSVAITGTCGPRAGFAVGRSRPSLRAAGADPSRYE